MALSNPRDTWVTDEIRAWCDTGPKRGDMLHSKDCAYICTAVEVVPASALGPRHTVRHVSPVNLDGKYLDHKGRISFTGDPDAA